MTWPFTPLQMFGYDVIVVDPPTRFELRSEKGNEKSAGAQYDLMSWEDIAALPVGHLARANAILLLWACPPTLRLSLDLMDAWGALYKTERIWDKRTKNGKRRMGTGYRSRAMHESLLLGVFGNERQIHDTFLGVFEGEARQHSRKPESFYSDVIAKTPGLSRCDLFGRQSRPGFDVWGNEATKFDEVAA
jgi:N6-adenosine-specific RNA methylase IME4